MQRSLAIHYAMQRQALACATALVKSTGLTVATVNRTLALLQGLGIVTELTGRQRSRVFACGRYVDELARALPLPA